MKETLTTTMSDAPESARQERSMLLFRVGETRLALPPVYAAAVIPFRAPHPVPHRRNPVFLGLIAFGGEIIPCCSLAPLLDEPAISSTAASRMLVLQERPSERWAVPVDAVPGVRCGRIADASVHSERSTSFLGAAFTDEDGATASLLEAESVFARWRRALA